ncbi:MAG: helix-turn-helix transcriptional regulator [Actinomycetota bacterium]|nr:helix-turn-helix transcriptional regulator [Actinomycetota bacterium]
MAMFKIGEAATLLGVSPDTVRRWADQRKLSTTRTEGGQRLVDGVDLAAIAAESSPTHEFEELLGRSARNRFVGIVTDVKIGDVAAQVEIQAGPHRVVSLLTSEAVEDLGLEPGLLALAVVKSTNVVIEVPR